MQARAFATIALILLVSFSLGYKGDALKLQLSRLRAMFHSEHAAAPVDPAAEKSVQAVQPMPVGLAPAVASAGPGVPPAVARAPGAPGPYGLHPMMPSPAPGGLANTLDSVRAPEVTDEVRAQRNTYFDALQKQLAQMKQQQQQEPPRAPDQPINAAPPPNNMAPGGPQQGFVLPQVPPPGALGGGANAFPMPGQSQGKDDETSEEPQIQEQDGNINSGPDDEDG